MKSRILRQWQSNGGILGILSVLVILGESLGVGMFIFVMGEGLRIVNILILSGRAILLVSIFRRREGLRVCTLRVRWCLPGNGSVMGIGAS